MENVTLSASLAGVTGTTDLAVRPKNLANGFAWATPDEDVCPRFQTRPPCVWEMSPSYDTSTFVPFSLNVATGGARAQVNYNGTIASGLSSATLTKALDESEATPAISWGYVLRSSTLAAGTPVSLSAIVERTGSLDVSASQVGISGGGVLTNFATSQDFLQIIIGSNSTIAFGSLNQHIASSGGDYVETVSWVANSNLFTFGLSGKNPVLISQPGITVTYSDESGRTLELVPAIVKFQIPIGQPFSLGVSDGLDAFGGGAGFGVTSATISPPEFTLPPGVTVQSCTGCQ